MVPDRTGTGGPPERYVRMPQPLRFLLPHAAVGFALAAAFVAALVMADPGGAGTLLTQPDFGRLPVLLLWTFTGLTFAGVQMGAAVMLLAHAEPPRRRLRRR